MDVRGLDEALVNKSSCSDEIKDDIDIDVPQRTSSVRKVNFEFGIDNEVDRESFQVDVADPVTSDRVTNGVGGEIVANSVNTFHVDTVESDINSCSVSFSDALESQKQSSSNVETDVTNDSNGSGIEELLDSIDPGGKSRRHVFILSSAGKPVYTRYGSEDKLVTLFGVMQALVSVVEDSDDTLHAIKCGKTCIAFLSQGPIILVGVAHNNDSLDYLRKKLKYIYSQVVSILTLTQLTKIFEERHNYDLRRLLSGSERIINHLLLFSETRPEFMLDSISCLQMPQSARDAISNTIVSCCSKIKNLVFAILIGNERIISLVSIKKYKLEPCDIHLICNLVSCAESFKTAESWTPICLPKFNPSGYLHAHVSYFTDCPACLLLLTVEKDSFFELSEARCRIEEKLIQNQCMVILRSALSPSSVPSMDCVDTPHIRHFIYKSKLHSQIFFFEISHLYDSGGAQWQDLFAKYEQLHSSMVNPLQPLKILYQQLANEVMLGWVTEKYELYIAFEPLIQKSDCINSVDKLLHWIHKEEEKIFMLNYFYFN